MRLVSTKSAAIAAASVFLGVSQFASAATSLSYFNSDTRNNSSATPSLFTNAAALDAAGLNGSLQYSTGPGDVAPNNKVAVTFYNPDASGSGTPAGAVLGTLGALNQLSFDYYVSSANGMTALPAVRLKLSPNGTPSTTYVDLVWEPAYNGGGSNDVWHNDVNVFAGTQWWQRSNNANHDDAPDFQPLSAFAGGYTPTFNGPGVTLNSSTPIYGVEISLGSGLPNNSTAYIDDLQLGFAGGQSFTGDVAVPEPGSAALLVLGAGALISRRSRRLSALV